MMSYEMIGVSDQNGRTYESIYGTYSKDKGFIFTNYARDLSREELVNNLSKTKMLSSEDLNELILLPNLYAEIIGLNYYIEHFNDEVLKMLSVPKVLADLQVLIPDYIKSKMDVPVWVNKDWHIALICYERPTDFCHRHLVSKWLNENHIECKEFTQNI